MDDEHQYGEADEEEDEEEEIDDEPPTKRQKRDPGFGSENSNQFDLFEMYVVSIVLIRRCI